MEAEVAHSRGAVSERTSFFDRERLLDSMDCESLVVERGGLIQSMAQARDGMGMIYVTFLTQVEDELDSRFPEWKEEIDSKRVTTPGVVV